MPRTRPAKKCTATNRQGKPCGNYAIHGGTVCEMHGGKTPAVQKAARQRLLEAADPAAAFLVRTVQNSRCETSVRVRAALGLLDRAGYGPNSTVQMTGADGGPVKFEGTPELRSVSTEQLEAMRAILTGGPAVAPEIVSPDGSGHVNGKVNGKG